MGILEAMIGRADERIRTAVFAWLADQPGEVICRTALEEFRSAISASPAMQDRVPLVELHAADKGRYLASWPVFVTGDDPARLRFVMQVDTPALALAAAPGMVAVSEDESEARRAYVTRSVRQRLHQVAFRERVMRAYAYQCAMCRLRHRELLDAAHITPDTDPEGEPVISNGLALCKLHHAAFDSLFFAIRPDYTVEVRQSILAETMARCWWWDSRRYTDGSSSCRSAAPTDPTPSAWRIDTLDSSRPHSWTTTPAQLMTSSASARRGRGNRGGRASTASERQGAAPKAGHLHVASEGVGELHLARRPAADADQVRARDDDRDAARP